ncbi:MAG: pseudaminic acid synthase [Alphaproteobacteria bacterium]|nr:pseudaminic acid synthase [Alphaproteobacteria bacterium]
MPVREPPPWTGAEPFIIAEASANHLGALDKALRLIELAKASGADAIKFQAYAPDTITVDCADPDFIVETPLWRGRTLYDLYSEAQTPFDWFPALWRGAQDIGILPLASVFDESALAMLEELGAALYKVASCELVDIGLIEKIAATGKPMILSTGMGSLTEIEEAVAAADHARRNGHLALLHCVSGYPTPPEDANLATMADLKARFDLPIGLSDHTLGSAVATAAAGLGAEIIEKHFTESRADGGPDAAFSVEPAELTALIDDARAAASARGAVHYGPTASEKTTLPFRRSLYTIAEIKEGEPFTAENTRSIRPAAGLAPRHLGRVLASRAARDLPKHHAIAWDDLSE